MTAIESSSSLLVLFWGSLLVLLIRLPADHAVLISLPLRGVPSDCGKKIAECGPQVAEAVLYNNSAVSANCCCRLVLIMGKPCHEAFVMKRISSKPEFKARQAEILKRGELVWKNCQPLAVPSQCMASPPRS